MQRNTADLKASIEAQYDTGDVTFDTDDGEAGHTAYDYVITQG